MTTIKNGEEIINRINSTCIDSHSIVIGNDIFVSPQSVNNVIKFLKEDVEIDVNFFTFPHSFVSSERVTSYLVAIHGGIVFKLLTYFKILPYDDRDSFLNKKIESSGELSL